MTDILVVSLICAVIPFTAKLFLFACA